MPDDDLREHWIKAALRLACRAEEEGEVPVGALIVYNGEIIGEGWNQPIARCDPSAHAEILALRQAASRLGNYRLSGASLYVTLEPCAMCIGAMIQGRIKNLVFGAWDEKAGAVRSVFKLLDSSQLNHRIDWHGGILAGESATLLRNFFQQRRRKQKLELARKEK